MGRRQQAGLAVVLLLASLALEAQTPEMVPVPGGAFVLPGTDRETVVEPFLMGACEVTQEEYRALMGDNPSYFSSPDKSRLPLHHGKGYYRSNPTHRPVESISWYDALAYCNRLSLRERLAPVYILAGDSVRRDPTADGYRLPTEAEWMWAAMEADPEQARAAVSGGRGLMPALFAWYRLNAYTEWNPLYNPAELFPRPSYGTKAVRQKRPNSLGLYDMSGNVWEWCEDRYGTRTADYGGPAKGVYRVAKGGSFHSPALALRLDYRRKELPRLSSPLIGMRVVRSLRPASSPR